VTIEKREVIRLSDGRELVYFDESPNADRAAYPDLRQLPPPPPTSQLR
jgi:UDPglucose--hexose-1-phosphate uridylyltransferase